MVFIVAAVVLIVSLLPGYLVLAHMPRSAGDDDFWLVPVCFLISFTLIAAIQFILFVLGLSMFWAGPALLGAVCAGLVLSLRRRGQTYHRPVPSLWFACQALFIVYLCVFLMLTPGYAVGYTSDWGLYYPVGLLFIGRAVPEYFTHGIGWEYLAKRTPMYTLYGAWFMGFCGNMYSVFQTACAVANAMVFWVVLGLLRQVRRTDACVTAGMLLLCAPGVIRVALVPEPKILGSAFVLMAWIFYTAGRDTGGPDNAAGSNSMIRSPWLCALAAVVAVMCHPSMLFYVIWLYVHQLFTAWKSRRLSTLNTRLWLASSGFAMILIGGWAAWLVNTFGLAAAVRPTSTVAEPIAMGLGEYLFTRLGMMITTLLVPLPLWDCLRQGQVFAAEGGFQGWIDLTGDAFIRYYQQSYLGAAGTLVAIGVIGHWIYRGHRFPDNHMLKMWLGWGIGGMLICFAVHLGITDYKGHALNLTAPLYLLCFCGLAAEFSRMSLLTKWLLSGTLVVEFLYVRTAIIILTRGRQTPGLTYVADATIDWLRGLGLVPLAIFAILVITAYERLLRRAGEKEIL